MAKWALHLRLRAAPAGAVDEALRSGEIVRTHIMRPTWHFVAGEDIRWMLMLSGKRVRLANESFGRRFGISEAQYCRCNDLIGDMLRGGKSMTCREIGSSLEKAGIPDASQLVRRFLLRAESDGIICSGPDRDRQPTFALFDERVPRGKELSRDEALATLATRYFRSHTPATCRISFGGRACRFPKPAGRWGRSMPIWRPAGSAEANFWCTVTGADRGIPVPAAGQQARCCICCRPTMNT